MLPSATFWRRSPDRTGFVTKVMPGFTRVSRPTLALCSDYCRPLASALVGQLFWGALAWSDYLPLKDPIPPHSTNQRLPNSFSCAPFSGRTQAGNCHVPSAAGSPGGVESILSIPKARSMLEVLALARPPFMRQVTPFQSKCESIYCGLVMKL